MQGKGWSGGCACLAFFFGKYQFLGVVRKCQSVLEVAFRARCPPVEVLSVTQGCS